MRCFLTLLQKEWRDARLLTYACMALVPIAHACIEWWFVHWKRPAFSAEVLLPVFAGLFAAVIASDLIAAEVASGRARTLAALPTRLRTVWAAKLTFLLGATLLFTAWVVASGLAVHGLGGSAESALWYVRALPEGLEQLLWLPGAIAGVVFCSTLLERGFAAVGGGVALVAGIAGLAALIPWYALEFDPRPNEMRAASWVLGLTLLGGSLLAFTRAPIHASGGLRKVALAFIVPIAILVPTTAVSAAALVVRAHVEPGETNVDLLLRSSSQDGRYLVLMARKRHRDANFHCWRLDIETGDMLDLQLEGMPRFDTIRAWTDEGHMRVWEYRIDQSWLRHVIDPATGKILETRSQKQIEALEKQAGLYQWSWSSVTKMHDAQTIHWKARGVELRVDPRASLQMSPVPGYAIHSNREKSVVLHDLAAGTSKVLHTADGPIQAFFSPRGEYVRVFTEGSWRVFRTRDGTLAYESTDDYGLPHWSGHSSDRFALLFNGTNPSYGIDLETGHRTPLIPNPNAIGWPGDLAHMRADGTVIMLHEDGTVRLHDRNGNEARTIYAPREDD